MYIFRHCPLSLRKIKDEADIRQIVEGVGASFLVAGLCGAGWNNDVLFFCVLYLNKVFKTTHIYQACSVYRDNNAYFINAKC